LDYRILGPSGVRVSTICLGTATFGVAPLEDDASDLVGLALERGINFFDTANSYGNQPRFDRPGAPPVGERSSAEEILGKAIRGHRDDIVLATKVSEAVGQGPNDGGWDGGGLSRLHIMREAERSLRRLGTDHIDLYYAHHPDPATPLDETMQAFDDLIRQGKVLYSGLSTFPAWQMVDALWTSDRLGVSAPVCNQVMYNLVSRGVEAELVPACARTGRSLTVFSPLAAGLLAGEATISDRHSGWRRFGADLEYPEDQRRTARSLDELASEWGVSSAQLATAWAASRPAVASVIVGAESRHELDVAITATELSLEADQLLLVDALGRPAPPFPF
jgi:aryl-alcohol dehydrogenase-like predicted oxidoreductase